MKHIIIGIVVLILVAAAGYFFYIQTAQAPTGPGAVQNGTGINPDASAYTYVNASGDTILVDSPKPNEKLGSSFTISGKAKGPWYFEASFPVSVTAPDGTLLAQLPAQAEGEWMTNDFVPFSVHVTIGNGYTGPATITLKKDNPSGDSERDASVSYPVTIQ